MDSCWCQTEYPPLVEVEQWKGNDSLKAEEEVVEEEEEKEEEEHF